MSGLSVAQPDITLFLDLEGVIERVALSDALPAEDTDGWLGRPWGETVEGAAGEGVRRMVEVARSQGVSGFGQVTQRFPSGLELRMEYTTIRLGGRSGLIAVGKSLQAVTELQSRLVAAQQAMERDYWKLREIETRYRLLFDASNEAVVLVNAADLRIVEANPAAIRAVGVAGVGFTFLDELAQPDREPFLAMLGRVREQGKAPAVRAQLGQARAPWLIRATQLAAEPGPVFLLQLTPAGVPGGREPAPVSLDPLIERSPDGFVLVDPDGMVIRANPAFLDLAQLGAEASVRGEPLGRWLGRPGADARALLHAVERHGSVRLFQTAVGGELGLETEVEVAAVGDRDRRPRHIGIFVHDVGQRLPPASAGGGLAATLGALTERIGDHSLPELVKDTVGAVEQHYIDAALARTGGNRTAAAELLGLSRQSLYVKLNRYGMDGAMHAGSDGSD